MAADDMRPPQSKTAPVLWHALGGTRGHGLTRVLRIACWGVRGTGFTSERDSGAGPVHVRGPGVVGGWGHLSGKRWLNTCLCVLRSWFPGSRTWLRRVRVSQSSLISVRASVSSQPEPSPPPRRTEADSPGDASPPPPTTAPAPAPPAEMGEG